MTYCHSFRPVYEHGRWRSVYEYDCQLTKSSIEAAGMPAPGLFLYMGLDSDDLLLHNIERTLLLCLEEQRKIRKKLKHAA